MDRFALAIIVALLTVSASGTLSLVGMEPCGVNEPAGSTGSECPPACVTCGCCSRAAEPVGLVVMSALDIRVNDLLPTLPPLPNANPRDILHVPKRRLA